MPFELLGQHEHQYVSFEELLYLLEYIPREEIILTPLYPRDVLEVGDIFVVYKMEQLLFQVFKWPGIYIRCRDKIEARDING